MQSYRMTSVLAQQVGGKPSATLHDSTVQQIHNIDATFSRLQLGDPQRPLYLPPDRQLSAVFDKTRQRWDNQIEPMAMVLATANGVANPMEWRSRSAEHTYETQTLMRIS